MKSLHKLCISTIFIATFSFSDTFHIATTGSDDNDGSESNPFATIQKGIDESIYGDTVLVAAGTYEGYFVAVNINHRYILSSSGRDSTIILNTNDFYGFRRSGCRLYIY